MAMTCIDFRAALHHRQWCPRWISSSGMGISAVPQQCDFVRIALLQVGSERAFLSTNDVGLALSSGTGGHQLAPAVSLVSSVLHAFSLSVYLYFTYLLLSS